MRYTEDFLTVYEIMDMQITILDGWRITDINASRPMMPTLDPTSDWLTITSFEIEYESYFWLAPKIYLGNRLSSYGSNLTFTASWIVMRGDTSGKPTTDPNVIIVVSIFFFFFFIAIIHNIVHAYEHFYFVLFIYWKIQLGQKWHENRVWWRTLYGSGGSNFSNTYGAELVSSSKWDKWCSDNT